MKEAVARERKAFGAELRLAMQQAGLRQVDVAKRVSVDQSTVSGWVHGSSEPAPRTVFLLEKILMLPGGALSMHLGYLPVTIERTPTSALEALQVEPGLTPRRRRMLIDLLTDLKA